MMDLITDYSKIVLFIIDFFDICPKNQGNIVDNLSKTNWPRKNIA
jgi:hypothetical protein